MPRFASITTVALCMGALPAVALPPEPDPRKPVDYRAWINGRFKVDPKDNAATLYRAALAAYVPPADSAKQTATGRVGDVSDEVLTANRKALDLCVAGSRRDRCFFEFVAAPRGESHDRWGPDVSHFKLRGLCRLLAARAAKQAFMKQPAGAAGDIIAILRVARHLVDQPSLPDYLCGMGVAENAFEVVDSFAAASPDKADVAAVAGALAALCESTPPIDAALECELALAWDRLQRHLRDNDQDGRCDAWVFGWTDVQRLPKPVAFAAAVASQREQCDRWNALLAEPLLPRAMLAADKLVRALDADQSGLNDYGFPRLGTLVARRGEFQARRITPDIVLLLHDFQRKHRRWPNTLDELSAERPGLAAFDPFRPTQSLVYRREGDSALLYSVGRDGADDEGLPGGGAGKDLVLWRMPAE